MGKRGTRPKARKITSKERVREALKRIAKGRGIEVPSVKAWEKNPSVYVHLAGQLYADLADVYSTYGGDHLEELQPKANGGAIAMQLGFLDEANQHFDFQDSQMALGFFLGAKLGTLTYDIHDSIERSIQKGTRELEDEVRQLRTRLQARIAHGASLRVRTEKGDAALARYDEMRDLHPEWIIKTIKDKVRSEFGFKTAVALDGSLKRARVRRRQRERLQKEKAANVPPQGTFTRVGRRKRT